MEVMSRSTAADALLARELLQRGEREHLGVLVVVDTDHTEVLGT